MTVNYAVTFEYETRPPDTYRGTVKAGTPNTCASRAVREAQKALRPVNWSSMVCVFLERVPDGSGGDAEAILDEGQDGDE